MSDARARVDRVGSAMGAHAIALFDRAATRLRGDASLGRAFRTVSLTGPTAPPGLCEEARPGSGMAGGTEDGRTSLRGWKFLGLIPLHAGEGEVDPDGDPCQRPKRDVHGIVRLALGPLELPAHAQLMVVRVGGMLLAAIPAELTSEAGFRLREVMLREATAQSLPVRSAALIGLANGYLQYVATPEEYGAQHYEGASTLYGPETLGMLETQVAELIGELARGDPPRVDPVEVWPGPDRSILPSRRGSSPRGPRLQKARCSGDTVVARWFDAVPGVLIPADGPVVEITRHREGSPASEDLSVWDDDRFLEIRALRSGGSRGYLWEARWTPPGGAEGRYTLRLLRWPPPDNRWEFSCR